MSAAHEHSASCSAFARCMPFIGTGMPGNGSREQCTRQRRWRAWVITPEPGTLHESSQQPHEASVSVSRARPPHSHRQRTAPAPSPGTPSRAALIEHAAHLGDLTEAIVATGWVSGELLGEPSAELRAKMAGSEVRLFTPYQSM